MALVAANDVILDFLSPAEQPILKKALAPKWDQRYKNCTELVAALNAVLAPKPRVETPAPQTKAGKPKTDPKVKPPLSDEILTPFTETWTAQTWGRSSGDG